MTEEQEFRLEFVDGEFRVYDSENRMIFRQNKFPDGSNDPWTEADALSWWEKNKRRFYQKIIMSYDDSTVENPEEGV